MEEKKPRLFPSMKLVAIAALAGMAAGLVAVYMKERAAGNGQDSVAEIDCGPAAATAAKIAPLASGQLAAFVVQKAPYPLTLASFKGLDGKAHSLGEFKGKVQLVNLWATWCVPCRQEMPALNALEKTLGGPKFQVTSINLDTSDDEKPKTFFAENGIDTLTLYHDQTMANFNAMKKYGLVIGLPATALLDTNGCLLGAMNGPAAWESEDAKALVKAAIGGV